MSWLPGFGALTSAWLFLLTIPLVLFYFLKLKRPRMVVPSTVLWRQVLQDRRVNSPFQRFKRHLLLLLQLLLLLLLVLSAMQPFWQGAAADIERLCVLIDCSASMAARAEPGGPTRLEVAKERVGALIDGLLPSQRLCLVSFSDRPQRRSAFSANRRLLRKALASIEVQEVASKVEGALRMAQALARTDPFDTVTLISDGNLPDKIAFDLPFEVDYQRLPPAGPNLGLTALRARLGANGQWQVFVGIEGATTGAARLRVQQDGTLVAEENIDVDATLGARLVVPVDASRASTVDVLLEPVGFDALAADNRAALVLPAARPLLIQVDPRLATFRKALTALPGLQLIPSEGGDPPPDGPVDVVIGDQPEHAQISARTQLLIGVLPPALAGRIELTSGAKGSVVVDWRRRAALLQHVDLRELVVLDRPTAKPSATTAELESLGFLTLVDGDGGPLLLLRDDGPTRRYWLLFHSDRSTLPYRIGFPILLQNLVAEARRRAGLAEVGAVRTGVLPAQMLDPKTTYTVEGPGGEQTVESDADGRLTGIAAPRTGVYRIKDGGTLRHAVGASLLDGRETKLVSIEKLEFGEALTVDASGKALDANKPLWRILAWLALLVLAGEWWLFNRRP